jgi:hypothetical protein
VFGLLVLHFIVLKQRGKKSNKKPMAGTITQKTKEKANKGKKMCNVQH